jgi:uncharacterized membrane protein
MRYFFLILFAASLLSSCNNQPSFKQISFDGSRAEADIKNLADKQAEFYTINIDGRKINFFIVMINGDVQSYFDACLTCYPKKLGFRFKDNGVICKTCDVGYPVDTLKDGIGSCYPIKLKGSRENDKYVIDKEDLKAGWKYF